MAKHIIYLRESSDGTFLMAKRLQDHHKELMEAPPQGNGSKATVRFVHQMLAQKVAQFEGWKLRMESMEKRMANVINLVIEDMLPPRFWKIYFADEVPSRLIWSLNKIVASC